MTWRKREIMDEIHSCSHLCTRPMCVAVREAVQAEREACARVAEEWLGPTKDRELHIAKAIRARGTT